MQIDWNKIKFVSKADEWFIEGTICKCEYDFGSPKETDKIIDNWGLFYGLTNETYSGYIGELPREDGETCSFEEFNIYLGEEQINDWTYAELIAKTNK